MITKLSKVAGVPVKAATTYQIVGRSDLVGNVLTARPDGTVTENLYEGVSNFGGLPLFEQAILFGAEVGHSLKFW